MEFTAEHDQFRQVVRGFVEREINPYVEEWEAKRIFPAHDLFPKLAEIGAFGLEYDEEYGGQGADHTYTLVLMEELGRCDCAGVPMAIAVQATMATPALHRFGTHELKMKYLKPAMEGRAVCAVAVSEPDAGSDVAAIRTRGRLDGDEWVINGRKMWITNGIQADWICTLVRTSDEGGFAGMSQIIVPTDTPGFSVGRKIEKMGNHSSDTAELIMDNVRVPASNTIGEIGRGFQQQMVQFQDERLTASYMAAAGARRALDRTIEYLRMREAFGKPLLANQYLQYNLAELIAEVDLLTEYNHVAAERVAAGKDATRMATIAKLKVGRLTRQVADAVVQYHGGMGYAEEMWPSRYARDSRLISIGGGADEVMLRILTLLEGMGKR
ncbi:MAG: acyl-CoA dehydrogenase family protein [Candidatus Nanopelagicales bacterium]|nr:acyl-CoA dehydrogenase family protein [Candidatus Nanopelagicales bacterium]MDZ4248906.1 acyl-CoA dehydrogenase family protein [Candidatus Nanopelagicales bacterium]